MTDKELQSKLRAIQALRTSREPNALWVAATRTMLLEKARAAQAEKISLAQVHTSWSSRIMFALRPVMAVLVMVGFGVVGWLTSVSAALGTVPGDPLYALKTATERARLTFTTDASTKTMLHLEFAGRRLNEVAMVAESNQPSKETDAAAAVDELQKEINSVASNLDEVKATASAQSASSVAQAVDRRVAEIRAVLNKTKNLVNPTTQKKINEIQDIADDVSVKAVAVLVQTTKQGVGPGVADVTSRVQEKIATAEEKIMATSTEANEEAKASLEQAKKALETDNLEEAVSKVQEVNNMVDKEEDVPVIVEPSAPADTNTQTPSNTNNQIKAVE